MISVPLYAVLSTLAMVVILGVLIAISNRRPSPTPPEPPPIIPPAGSEIIVCGQRFDIGWPVVTWDMANGYDAYAEHCFFTPATTMPSSPVDPDSTRRYGQRRIRDAQLRQRVQADGWTMENLQDQVTQFVIHFDAVGYSKGCFRVLHDIRGLSSHFLLDVDGTIYQTLDLKERAWHAAIANDKSIGIEIAHIGARSNMEVFEEWYTFDETGWPVLTFPETVIDPGVRLPNFIAKPARKELFEGRINGQTVMQYDFTNEQYEAMIALTKALAQLFPNLALDVPRDSRGDLRMDDMSDAAVLRHQGLIAHWHISRGKVDPGPALDWDRVLTGASQSN